MFENILPSQEEFWRKNLAYTAHQFANTSSDIMIEASEINKLHTEMKRKIMMMFAVRNFVLLNDKNVVLLLFQSYTFID